MEISGETENALNGNTKKRVNQLISWFLLLTTTLKKI